MIISGAAIIYFLQISNSIHFNFISQVLGKEWPLTQILKYLKKEELTK